MSELSVRREKTEARLTELRGKLEKAELIAAGKACVYATGSFGRCEVPIATLTFSLLVKQRLKKSEMGKRNHF